MGVVVSPELALVDDELRALARDSLPPIEPYAFLGLLAADGDRRTWQPAVAVANVQPEWRRRVATVAPWLLVALLGTLLGLLIGYWVGQLRTAQPGGIPPTLQSLYLLQRL